MKYEIKEPFTKDKLKGLITGDTVLLSGTIYSARDAAHKRLCDMLSSGEMLPIDLDNSIIYYMGPTPARPGRPSGSAGPTTSYRMDGYTPVLLAEGISAMIGKGPRSEEVKKSAARHGAVYFAAIGGAAALIAQSIVSSEVVAFEELGAEALRRLKVENMPLVVAFDTQGRDIYDRGWGDK